MLLLALVSTSMIALYLSTMTTRTLIETRATRLFVEQAQTFCVAEGALDQALKGIKDQMVGGYQFPTEDELAALSALPPQVAGYTFAPAAGGTYQIAYATALSQQQFSEGPFAGMNGWTRSVQVVAKPVSDHGRTTRLVQTIQLQLVPIFQFAIFDHNDFELHPGPPMTVDGPIHANGTLSLGSMDTWLEVRGRVTASGEILHDGTNTDDVLIADSAGDLQNMKNPDGSWLESTDPEWATESVARWGGTVKAHAPAIQLPLPESVSPIAIIKPCDPANDTETLQAAKLCYKADLLIMDGVARYPDGSPASLPPGTVSSQTFWDAREEESMTVTEIDVDKLSSAFSGDSDPLLYVGSSAGFTDGVRLVNGEGLPDAGLTVVTHQPLYVKGDYNTKDFNTPNRRSAALIADGITALSKNWDDTQHSNPASSPTVAKNTELNAALMAGRVSDGGSQHLIRFLEDWGGKIFSLTGSEITLWESEESSAELKCCWNDGTAGGVYDPPKRNWKFDTEFLTDMSSLPPHTPSVYTMQSLIWQQEQ
jgi:hypothetical protein